MFVFILCLSLVCGVYFLGKKIASYIKKRNETIKLREEVEELLPSMNKALQWIEDNITPNRYVSSEELYAFLNNYNRTIGALRHINLSEYCDFSIRIEMGVSDFLENVSRENLQSKIEENNKVYNSIEALKTLAVKASATYRELTASSHYISYSDMENFKASMAQIDEAAKIVLPKYSQYITDETTRDILNIKDKIETLRESHNQNFISTELASCSYYFDTVLGKYPLDPQQRDSIVKLEDNCLVIASAGSGKTSTILGKAKYLVEKRNIPPSKILLITYTRKAANELHERMQIDGITCCTFHKLAKDIIGQVTGQAPTFCDNDVTINIFHRLIETNGDFLHAINNYLINQQSLMGLEHDYTDAFTYFEDRKKYGIQALFRDVDDKIIFTRSEEEKRLVSILTRLGVLFRYENAYEVRTITPERRQYKPDFTNLYIRIDGWSPIAVVRNGAAHHKPQTFIFLRTLSVKTQLVALRHIPKVASSLHFFSFYHCRHISCKVSEKSEKSQINQHFFLHHYASMLNVSASFNVPQAPMYKGFKVCHVNRLIDFCKKTCFCTN